MGRLIKILKIKENKMIKFVGCEKLLVIQYDFIEVDLSAEYHREFGRNFDSDWYEYYSEENFDSLFYDFVTNLGEVAIGDLMDDGVICLKIDGTKADGYEADIENKINKWVNDQLENCKKAVDEHGLKEAEAEDEEKKKRDVALAKLSDEDREILGV
jgi:hypothetical protein